MDGCPHCGNTAVQIRPDVYVQLDGDGDVQMADVLGGKFHTLCPEDQGGCGREFRTYISSKEMDTMTVRSIGIEAAVDL